MVGSESLPIRQGCAALCSVLSLCNSLGGPRARRRLLLSAVAAPPLLFRSFYLSIHLFFPRDPCGGERGSVQSCFRSPGPPVGMRPPVSGRSGFLPLRRDARSQPVRGRKGLLSCSSGHCSNRLVGGLCATG